MKNQLHWKTDIIYVILKYYYFQGGRFCYVEHVSCNDNSWSDKMWSLLTPLWMSFKDNCHMGHTPWIKAADDDAGNLQPVFLKRLYLLQICIFSFFLFNTSLTTI